MDELYLMTPMEIVWGYLIGHTPPSGRATAGATNPREVLERVVRVALQRPPCGVAFSGGRDSSLVLAVATHVARREGLPEPVPITRVFPQVSEADENEWQEAVVRHLGLADWQRVVIEDELDVVGPIATQNLLAHGVVWPASIASDRPVVDVVNGGSVIDGEGGDEVLGVAAHRIANVARILRQPRPLQWRRIRPALAAVAPAPVRGRHERRRWEENPFTWLRPDALDPLVEMVERAERDRPLSFAESVRMVPRRRTQVLAARNRRILASARGVDYSSPLLHPDFVDALAHDGGILGRGDRTAALRSLASDLLPDSVLSRTSKAVFTRCYMGQHTREFALQWTGDGVDPGLVDPEELRRIWLTEAPPAPTAALLQSAWLATSGGAA